MSKIEELIEKLCPNGVEYKTIKSVVGVNRGSRLTKSELCDDFEYDVYHGSKDTILGKYKDFNAPQNTTIVVNTGGIGGVKFINKKFWCSDGSFWLGKSVDIDDKFLYYCLSSYEDYFASKKRVGGVPTIDKSVIEEFEIPVPPIEVQKEIVRILDNFTELTIELTTELTARRKQYEYYRDKLLTFDVKISKSTIGQSCFIYVGGDVPKENFSKFKSDEFKIPIVSNGVGENAIYGYTKFAKITKPAVTISARGTIGYAEYRNYPYFPIVRLLSVIPQDESKLNTKYLFYCLQNRNYNTLSSGINQLTTTMLEKEEIYIPPLDIQQRIVEVLDNFDKLVNDLSNGLPAEIEARQKQYEYYRDKLLNFKRKN